MNGAQTRQELLAAASRDEAEMERALGDLKRAVQRPIAVSGAVGERLVGHHPLIWPAAGLLIGIWMGCRSAARRQS